MAEQGLFQVEQIFVVQDPARTRRHRVEARLVRCWDGGDSIFKRRIRVPLGRMYHLLINGDDWIVSEATLEEMLWRERSPQSPT